MVNLLKRELGVVRSQIRENLEELIIICSAVLFLTLAQQHSFGERWSDAAVFYTSLPILTVILFLRKNPMDFGLRLGNWRVWLLYVVVTCLAAFPILFAASRVDSLHTYYSVDSFDLRRYSLQILVYLSA